MTVPAERIQAVVFDLGKVLLDFDYGIAAKRIAARCRDPGFDVRSLIDQSPLLYRFELGLMNRREFFDHVQGTAGFHGNEEDFSAMFADIFSEIPEMIRLNARLREGGQRTFIFSNTNALAIDHIQRRFPFFKNFDDYIFSYEHGSMKPAEKIYRVVEERTGRSGAEILYIDDRPENTAAGAGRGWLTIRHENAEKTWAAARDLKLVPG